MNDRFGISEKSYLAIIETLRSFSEIDQAIIFGSRAKKKFKKGSDIDIVLKGENVTPSLALDVTAILNEEKPIPYFVDVISYAHINNTALKDHIDRVGIIFYTKTNCFDKQHCFIKKQN